MDVMKWQAYDKQLRHQQDAHREVQTMLKTQALATETFQSKWQMDLPCAGKLQ